MQLTVRQKGKYWYVRGVVKGQGKKKEYVPEQRTGCDNERAAENYADNLEKEILARLQLGIEPPKPGETPRQFSDAVTDFVTQTLPKNGDLWRIQKMLGHFKDTPLQDFDAALWQKFCKDELPGTVASTRARYQTTLRQIFREAGAGVKFPDIPHNGKKVERVRWLQIAEADRLIDAYTPRARAIALTLRFMGLRSSEALHIQRSDYDGAQGEWGSVQIKGKNGDSRWVPLHPRVREAWEPLLKSERSRTVISLTNRDPLFLTDKGEPYKDRRLNGSGSNPFAKAHRGACERAKVTDFTPHDWRHHWASWALREGMDMRTLQVLGGWRELNMVSRYAAPDLDDAAKKMARMR